MFWPNNSSRKQAGVIWYYLGDGGGWGNFIRHERSPKIKGSRFSLNWFSRILAKSGVLRAKPRMEPSQERTQKHLSRVWSKRVIVICLCHGRVCVCENIVCIVGGINKVKVAFAGHGTVCATVWPLEGFLKVWKGNILEDQDEISEAVHYMFG